MYRYRVISGLYFPVFGLTTGLKCDGLHLNETGTGKLVVNFIKKIKNSKTLIFVLIILFTRLENKEMKINKTLSEPQKCSCACDLSDQKGFDKLNVAKSQNPKPILIADLNINSLRNKFEILKETITT